MKVMNKNLSEHNKKIIEAIPKEILIKKLIEKEPLQFKDLKKDFYETKDVDTLKMYCSVMVDTK